MLSRLIGTARIEQLASELSVMRAEMAGRARELSETAGAADMIALKADVAGLAARILATASEGDALRRMVETLDWRMARLEGLADDHAERMRAAGTLADEVTARNDAEQRAQRLELRKLQMRLDAHVEDMKKTATALVRQTAKLGTDKRQYAAGSTADSPQR